MRERFSLHRKVLAILLLFWVGLFVLLTLTAWKIFQINIANLEIQQGDQEIRSVENMLRQEVRRLDDIAKDWAGGNYGGVAGGMSRDFFTPDNLRVSMSNLRVHALWLVKSNGSVLGGMNLNPYTRRPISIDGFVFPKLQVPSVLLERGLDANGICGFIWTGQGLLAVSAHPTQHEDRIGTPPGILVVGRLMGTRELQYLQGVMFRDFFLVNPVRDRLPLTNVNAIVSTQTHSTFIAESDATFLGITSMQDLEGHTTIQLRVRMSRELYWQARTSWWQFASGMFFISLATGVLILMIIRRTILARLELLDRSVAAVGPTGEAQPAIPDLGYDELGRLGRQINSMLERLRQSTGALAQSETRLRLFLEHFPGIAFQTDADNRFRLLYGAVKTITGYPAEEFLAGRRAWESIVHPDDLVAFTAHRGERLTRPGETGAHTYRIRTATGDLRTVTEQGRFVPAAPGRLEEDACVEGSIHDVTHEKQLESQLHRAQHLESIGRLTSGIAHDFNNVLQGILGHNLLAKRAVQAEKWDKIPSHLEVIEKASARGSGLIRDLLAFCRRNKVENEPVDMNAMVREIHHFLNRTLPPSITFNMDLDHHLPGIHANPSQVQQILLNLCVNARDAMPEGGTLLISTSVVEAKLSETAKDQAPAPSTSGQAVCLKVHDTGGGIPPEIISRIFEPFFTTKLAKGGSGLGLSMVYGAVQSMNGRITCDSTLGTGTTFTILLPIHEPPAARLT